MNTKDKIIEALKDAEFTSTNITDEVIQFIEDLQVDDFESRITFSNADLVFDIPAEDVVVRSVRLDKEQNQYEEVFDDSEANAFGVYLIHHEAHETDTNNIPSEWIADLESRWSANKFAALIERLMRNGMTKK
jgi:hypothetical protein